MTAAPDEQAVYADGAAWAGGPQAVYGRLAAAALAGLPDRLDGLRALDVGAGTGAATLELLRRGADVAACDTSTSMLAELARQTDGRVPTFVADILQLGVPDAEYDITIAAFVLNHLEDPAAAVRELARVTRPDGRVIATTFGADDHPMKAAIDDVLMSHGWSHPSWYLTIKRERMPRIASPTAFAAVGAAGGLNDLSVDELRVDLDDLPIEATITYRLGMPHIAPFLAALDEPQVQRIKTEIAAKIAPFPPFRLSMLVLSGRG